MKKILFICDSDHFPDGAFRFIEDIQKKEPVFLKGIFFSPVDYRKFIPVSYIPMMDPYIQLMEEDKTLVEKSRHKFVSLCDLLGIPYHLDDTNEGWDNNIFMRETGFSDLAVISEELFCSDIMEDQPNYFMHQALHNTQCPIMVVQEKYKGVNRLAIAYDGKKESIFAMKQFSYLFPQWCNLTTDFVCLKKEMNEEIPELELLKEYGSVHFPSMKTSKLHFDRKTYFPVWLEDKENVLLVTGCYTRSSFSNLFKQSFADTIIHDHVCPVFIAHGLVK